ncbi:MAG: DUF1540 domain-containing protein [Defluviitaleaceae bacterium]|nr:DUF1540 domain-containing protein [Defluviitaleaceae bacterium]
MSHQEIKCNVESCRFNSGSHHCTLNEITVGSESPSREPDTEQDTICASFSHK